jgi:oxaloacetate decarboxylase beta subunit
MGIGVLLDVGYMLRRPFLSIFLALFAEMGTFLVVPIASAMGMSLNDSASIAMVGGADGPMVLFTSMILSKDLFVPITIVAYLYLGFTYGGYPYLIKLLVPKHIRGIQPPKPKNLRPISSSQKLLFAVVMCVVLCLLFPVAAPLFFSLFLGVAVREADITPVVDFIKGPLLYGSTWNSVRSPFDFKSQDISTVTVGNPCFVIVRDWRIIGRIYCLLVDRR